MLPKFFHPTTTEAFNIAGKIISIPKCIVTFNKWTGTPVKETFGGKPIVNVSGKPMFAELAILTYFQNDAWQARWVETYGKKEPICLTEWKDEKYSKQVHVPFENQAITKLLTDIAKLNGDTYSGCWDVVASKDDKIVFAESKRAHKDSIRSTQINWLSAGLKYGLHPDNFIVVQWDMQIVSCAAGMH